MLPGGLSDNVREQEKLSQLLVDCHWDFTLSARSATGNEIGGAPTRVSERAGEVCSNHLKCSFDGADMCRLISHSRA
jgi:hypothetical protein